MAATVGYITFEGIGAHAGRTFNISIYNAASAAPGTYIPCDYNAPANANSPLSFTVPFPCKMMDFVPTAASGTVEITSEGRRTGVVLDYSLYGATNPGRPKTFPKFAPGRTYRLLVISTLAA